MERTLSSHVKDLIGETVLMEGWAQTVRDHAKVLFIDLRDRTGITQLVFTGELLEQARTITPESVLRITGEVSARPQSLINVNIVSGTVELQVKQLEVLSIAKPLPFPLNDEDVNEEVRLKYRYLDLRSKKMAQNVRLRHQMNQYIRDYLTNKGFTEVETPYISKSTPEGARDYLIPARIDPGNFYALPQSPQQYKQLLMVAGIEKYFQIVRCFRDEDARTDRQPEFTQLDIEESFVSRDDILELVEGLFLSLVKEFFPEKILTFGDQIPRFSYREVMERYGTDKPDLRKDPSNADELAFAFVVDFPLFEWKESEKRWDATHHPFTAPKHEWEDNFEKHPKEAISEQYDFVLNGLEIAGGSIRIHAPKLQSRVFQFMGHTKEQVEEKFGHLLEAFEYGVPPHGGIAPGLDRFYSVVLKEPSIRDVIAFAKAGDGRDLMMMAPSSVDPVQLKELGIKVVE